MRSFVALIPIAIALVGCSLDSTSRSDRPLTRAQALKKIDFPLPLSAHNVYFLAFSGGLQDLEFYVRFDVDPSDLDSAADTLIAKNNETFGRTLKYLKLNVGSADLPLSEAKFLPMHWWDPETVSKGYYRGHIEGYALRVLIDQARSRIYLYQND